MRLDQRALARLERLARLRSDIEMRRFSAFRTSVEAARGRISAREEELGALFRSDAPFSLAEARLTNAMTIDHLREIRREEEELRRILPRYETARQAALRAFGRAEVMGKIRQDLVTDERARKNDTDSSL
ncbi:hypothetical protein [Paracoccus aminophilus]|uniref:Uncharacterized protein n=1 Tax=Paracoccus aminophilus JCM 7686 TaxID=1367847 RepID=S5XVN5_PARAH|nr:hypothetical protein [Paracoccus aminophilus]AGT07455.1 hypothetical protein JCM7686_0346 [Paracoccus aminophilus JCM 7686]